MQPLEQGNLNNQVLPNDSGAESNSFKNVRDSLELNLQRLKRRPVRETETPLERPDSEDLWFSVDLIKNIDSKIKKIYRVAVFMHTHNKPKKELGRIEDSAKLQDNGMIKDEVDQIIKQYMLETRQKNKE